MNVDLLLPILTFVTLGAVIVFALYSKYRTRERKHDPNDPGSSLARETPDPNFMPDATVTRKDIYPDAQTTPAQNPTGQAPVDALGPRSTARHPDGQHGFDDR